MRNQYETVQRGGGDEQERANRDVDATAERLRQLAARQQQENERARRKADSLSMTASGARGGDAQRQLAQEAEQAARQLERLARERQSQSLADAARRLNEAADAMRRSAASQGQGSAASSAAALDRLREAGRLLDDERNSRAQRAADDAAATGRRLQEEQRRVTDDVAREAALSGRDRDTLQRRIADRKGAMADTARALADRLDRAAREAARDQGAAANKLQAAADTLRARRIPDKLRATQARIRDIPDEAQQANERIITSDIEQLNRALESARVAAQSRAPSDARRAAELGERARDLVRGMESLDERERQGKEQRSGAQTGGQSGTPADRAQSQQSARELRERLNDARALRRDIGARGGVDASQLDGAIRGMERLAGGAGRDRRAERELRAQVIEGLRAFEFTLSGALGERAGRVLVDRSGEIPPQYRRYVEEYYRSLGRTKPR
jgi:hypothetical protein